MAARDGGAFVLATCPQFNYPAKWDAADRERRNETPGS